MMLQRGGLRAGAAGVCCALVAVDKPSSATGPARTNRTVRGAPQALRLPL